MKTIKSIILIVAFFLISCNVSRTHEWANKKVTENAYKRKLNRHTKRFIRKTPDDIKKLLLEVEFIYDTTANMK